MDNDSKMPIRTWVHCFTAGTQTSAQGVTRDFSVKDLKQVVESYDPVIHEAPVRVGHEDSDKVPAFGWVKGFRMDGSKLYADVEFTPDMSEMLRNGNYKKVSISMYSPESGINPTPGKWSARHLAVLGATPPAVKGLEAIQFSEQDWVFDFSAAETLESVHDPELGPTLESESSPIASLKEALETAKAKDSKKEKPMADEQNLEVNEELQEEQLEVSAEQEETDFAEDKKKAPKQGEEEMEDEGEEEEDEESDMPFSKKKGGKKAMSEDHASCEGDMKKKKKGEFPAEECTDCQHEEGDGDTLKRNKKIKDQFYAEDHEESEEDEIDAAHGEETGKAKDGVGEDRTKKAKAKDSQGPALKDNKGKGKEAAGYGKSAIHSAYTGKEAKNHAYPKGVQVDNYEEGEENISEDHFESPMELTGDTRMANVVEQITKESQLEAMMKQIEHLSAQVKAVEEENDRLRGAAEKAMKDKRRSELQQFVSALYESGKLTDAVMTQEKLVGFCEGLDDGTLEFSEEGETPSSVLLNLLASLPAQVEFGEMSMDSFEFEEDVELSPHELATRLAGEEGISYVDALKRVMY